MRLFDTVSGAIHRATLDALAHERGQREILTSATRTLETQLGFMCARVNQLEAERAVLTERLLGVEIPRPTFTAAVTRPAATPEPADLLAGDPFADMGDAEAKRRGLKWDSAGRVIDVAESDPYDSAAVGALR